MNVIRGKVMELAQANIIDKAREYIREILSTGLNGNFVFHNLEHTLNVEAAVQNMCIELKCNKADAEIVILAALFHDTGFLKKYFGHEEESTRIARKFLESNNFPDHKIEAVCATILSTKITQEPTNMLEKILCDADLSHLASPSYCAIADRLKEEWEKLLSQSYDSISWKKINLNFLMSHRYYTAFGQEVLEPRKRKNIERFRAYIEDSDD